MLTNKQIVSEVINDLRLLNIDEHISRRFVLFKLKQKAKNLISQKLLDRTLSYEYNLFKTVKCFELKKIDTYKCDIVEFKSCNTVMKSVKPLPEPIYSRLGHSVKEVTNIDGSLELTPINLDQYRRNKRRQTKDSFSIFYYIDSDGYLYIPDKDIEVVTLKIITVNPEEIEQVQSCGTENKCKSGWDFEFIVPDKLQQAVYKDALINELVNIYKRVQIDENPDLSEHSKV